MVSVGYYTVIAVQALLVLQRYPQAVSETVNKGSHLVVWSIALFVGIVPAFTGSYGPTSPNHAECWVQGLQSAVRLLFYTPVIVSLLFATFLLL